MTPLHPTFRELVLRRIRRLDRLDLQRYESLLALRLDLVHHSSLAPADDNNPDVNGKAQRGKGKYPKQRPYGKLPECTPPPPVPRRKIEELITQATTEANSIIAPHRTRFDALHDLWVARRQLALQQGNMLSIPTDWEGLKNLIVAILRYWRVQVKTYLILTGKWLLDLGQGRERKRYPATVRDQSGKQPQQPDPRVK
jgi:hypothetical protein